jgi:DNA-binding PadR family transcriptional regulator
MEMKMRIIPPGSVSHIVVPLWMLFKEIIGGVLFLRGDLFSKKGLAILYYSMYNVQHCGGRGMVRTNEGSTPNLETELRRGALVLAVLSQMRTAQYGYSLRQALAEQGMSIEEGTLYPLLRRLEEQGLLASDWRIEDGNPPRRYYKLNSRGARLLADLTANWQALVVTMNRLLR